MKNEIFAKRLSQALTENGLKPVYLANKTGIDKSSISHYLAGNYEPKSSKLLRIAEVLNVSETWLMGYDVPKEPRDSLLGLKDSMLFTSIQNLANNKLEEELLVKCTMLNDNNKVKVLEITNMYLREQGDLYFQDEKGNWIEDKNNQ